MAYTQQQLADLEAVIAEGVSNVSANGRQVGYRNLSDLLKLRDQMQQELGVSGAGRRRHYVSFKRD
jgi:hypothetical protein